ncbi:hypothetical protein LNQ81_14650 [Myroides sp. M-43]|uniref:hypothetical protein n=1 Tax=Myroides oncorhynchi TaxID=2893756 RepID=UPI001E480009|nr:hypothetical protein [Myroides oncorhynchi]MCC9043916.1 hypothetical protein [Myroides oncorhynchi]
MRKYLSTTLCFFLCFNAFSQEQLMDSIIQKNYSTFSTLVDKESFKGQGWDLLLKETNAANSVVVGEMHFTNEVPYFINALIGQVKFDNYFQEIDPYSNRILEQNIKSLSPDKLNLFVHDFNSTFSFLERKNDFKLYEKMVKQGIHTFGLEQVFLESDRLLLSDLQKNTKNKDTYAILSEMIKTSKELSLNEDIYLFTEDFLEKSTLLLKSKLSVEEREYLEAMKVSREIYLGGNHHLRIQVMKNILLKEIANWSNKKNLFKFGAVHTPKGESLMEIYDIGNLVSSIEDANFRNSLHIMLIGKSAGETEEDLKLYKSFLGVVTTDEWHCFDLRPLQKAISTSNLKIEDQTLLRIIKGNDYLIYIPHLTESEKFSTK